MAMTDDCSWAISKTGGSRDELITSELAVLLMPSIADGLVYEEIEVIAATGSNKSGRTDFSQSGAPSSGPSSASGGTLLNAVRRSDESVSCRRVKCGIVETFLCPSSQPWTWTCERARKPA